MSFRNLNNSETNTLKQIRHYVTKFLMNDVSVKNLKLTGDPSAGKIEFKHYTPTPGSDDLAVTIGGVEHAYEWDNPQTLEYQIQC